MPRLDRGGGQRPGPLGQQGRAEAAARSGCPPIEAGAQVGGRLEGSVVDPGVSSGLSPWVSCWQGRSEETSVPPALLSHLLPASSLVLEFPGPLGSYGKRSNSRPTSHPRRNVGAPPPAVPGSQALGRRWEDPYLGRPSAVRTWGSRAGPEGPYLVRNLKPEPWGQRAGL